MVDFFVVVASSGAGDELQGIKRGLLELADVVAVNKADGDQVERANRAAMEYRTALTFSPRATATGIRRCTLSARDNRGLDALWAKIEERHAALNRLGALRHAVAIRPPLDAGDFRATPDGRIRRPPRGPSFPGTGKEGPRRRDHACRRGAPSLRGSPESRAPTRRSLNSLPSRPGP